MELFDLIQTRRSIRKYTKQKIDRETLEKIATAGLYAPNAGGRQGTKILMIDDAELIEKIGVINANCENRNWNAGVSSDQPSIIDDKTIRSGFYGCQALAMVCIQKRSKTAVNGIGTAFVCAENMVLQACAEGVSSVIVGRAEATFQQPELEGLPEKMGLDPDFMPIVFVCLGYIDGPYPKAKPRNEGRLIFYP